MPCPFNLHLVFSEAKLITVSGVPFPDPLGQLDSSILSHLVGIRVFHLACISAYPTEYWIDGQ